MNIDRNEGEAILMDDEGAVPPPAVHYLDMPQMSSRAPLAHVGQTQHALSNCKILIKAFTISIILVAMPSLAVAIDSQKIQKISSCLSAPPHGILKSLVTGSTQRNNRGTHYKCANFQAQIAGVNLVGHFLSLWTSASFA